jgi:hypothetical protein
VLVDDATPPAAGQLPPALRALPAAHVMRVRHTNLEDDIAALIGHLSHVAESAAAAPGPAPTTPAVTPPGPAQASAPPPPLSSLGEQVAPPPDQAHYQMVCRYASNLVVFLGAGVNAEEHAGDWEQGAAMLPDDHDLARHLAAKAGLESQADDLAEVAQRARAIHGEYEVFQWVKEALLSDAEPGEVHRQLARLPSVFEQHTGEKRYQMIITPKYDAALERAFREAREEFDVAVYMAPGTDEPGRFIHLPWDGQSTSIDRPNDYFGFPITEDGRLTRTLIVRINGAVEDPSAGFVWQDNYVITEDHYIDYLSGQVAEEAVPAQILAKLKRASYLFLGYTLADWRLRVFLQRIWRGQKLGRAKYWAVERAPDLVEKELWHEAGATLYTACLGDYLAGLENFLGAQPAAV